MIMIPNDAPAWAQLLALDLNKEIADLRQQIAAIKDSGVVATDAIDALDDRVTVLETP